MKTWKQFIVESAPPDAPKGTTYIPMQRSKMRYEDAERHWQDDDKTFHHQEVETDKLRATQSWHNPKWKPEHSAQSDAAHGVRTPDGLVHISDGHHRALHAMRSGKKTFAMHVKDVKEYPKDNYR